MLRLVEHTSIPHYAVGGSDLPCFEMTSSYLTSVFLRRAVNSQRVFTDTEITRTAAQTHKGRLRLWLCSSFLCSELKRPFSSKLASSLSKLDSVVVDMSAVIGGVKKPV